MPDINEEKYPSNAISKKVAPIRPTDGKPKVMSNHDPSTKPIARKKKLKRTGKVLRQKKSFTQKLSETFLGEDTNNVGSYILYDVLIPAAKSTIQEMITSGIEMLLYGESRPRSRKKDDRGFGRVSYSSFFDTRRSDRRDDSERVRPRGRSRVDQLLFENGRECADVLESLENMLEEYETVSVADYYELAGVPGNGFIDNKWGWENLKKAYCKTVRGGFTIIFPEPIELD